MYCCSCTYSSVWKLNLKVLVLARIRSSLHPCEMHTVLPSCNTLTEGPNMYRISERCVDINQYNASLPTQTAVAWEFLTSVCESVCLIFRTISQKPMQVGSPNVTQKCSTMSLGNPFILGSKSQGHESKTFPAWVFALLWVSDSSIVVAFVNNDHRYRASVDR